MVVAIVIVINSVIGGYSLVDLVWLATSTVWLQDYSQLSDYSSTEWLVKNEAANTPIMFEEILMAMIKNGNRTEWSPIRSVIIRVINKMDDRKAGVRFVNRNHYNFRKKKKDI